MGPEAKEGEAPGGTEEMAPRGAGAKVAAGERSAAARRTGGAAPEGAGAEAAAKEGSAAKPRGGTWPSSLSPEERVNEFIVL